jgi:hypothetical protein
MLGGGVLFMLDHIKGLFTYLSCRGLFKKYHILLVSIYLYDVYDG